MGRWCVRMSWRRLNCSEAMKCMNWDIVEVPDLAGFAFNHMDAHNALCLTAYQFDRSQIIRR